MILLPHWHRKDYAAVFFLVKFDRIQNTTKANCILVLLVSFGYSFGQPDVMLKTNIFEHIRVAATHFPYNCAAHPHTTSHSHTHKLSNFF